MAYPLACNLNTVHDTFNIRFGLVPETDPIMKLDVTFHSVGNAEGSHLEFQIARVQRYEALEADWERAHPAGRVERGISEDRIALWNFAVNGAELKSQHEAENAGIYRTRWPIARLNSNIVIEGHASNTGPERINDPLSINRAETVAQSVIGDDNLPGTVTDNVYSNRVWVTSYASSHPRVPGDTFENRHETGASRGASNTVLNQGLPSSRILGEPVRQISKFEALELCLPASLS